MRIPAKTHGKKVRGTIAVTFKGVSVSILVECRRLLRPGGLVSCSVDMHDHCSFDDSRLRAKMQEPTPAKRAALEQRVLALRLRERYSLDELARFVLCVAAAPGASTT
jgi:hypothetical protein